MGRINPLPTHLGHKLVERLHQPSKSAIILVSPSFDKLFYVDTIKHWSPGKTLSNMKNRIPPDKHKRSKLSLPNTGTPNAYTYSSWGLHSPNAWLDRSVSLLSFFVAIRFDADGVVVTHGTPAAIHSTRSLSLLTHCEHLRLRLTTTSKLWSYEGYARHLFHNILSSFIYSLFLFGSELKKSPILSAWPLYFYCSIIVWRFSRGAGFSDGILHWCY